MKKVLTVLSLMVFTVTAVFALDGDTYRAERERVESLSNSTYIQPQVTENGEIAASSTSGKKVKRKRRFWSQDPTQYYYFGAFTKFKGSNGH